MLQDGLDQLAFEETKKLIVDLAINWTSKTKRLTVPKGTRHWSTETFDPNRPERLKTITIELIPFFGTYAGYNSEVDILVTWYF